MLPLSFATSFESIFWAVSTIIGIAAVFSDAFRDCTTSNPFTSGINMDIQLPGIDGLDAARLIKADPTTRHARIVAVTAFAMQGDREKIIKAGCDAYIAKPIRYREFFDTVNELLGLQGQGGAPDDNAERDETN
jgi:CheY-like chemotaxis protein